MTLSVQSTPAGSAVQTAAHRPCPLCVNSRCRKIGPILHPRPATVAGVRLDIDEQAFVLLACDRCGFQYKSPAIAEEKLLACYAASSEDFAGWVVNPYERRFDMMRDMILRATNGKTGRILDIGCFHGSFLDYLGPAWQRFGVEPSANASRVAQGKGISILSSTLDSLPSEVEPFDVITAMDLIEHLNEPMPFFTALHERLSPRGVVLLLSGDTDAWSWRLMSNLYWYCSLPEHCAFFNRRSLEFVSNELGFGLIDYRRLGHSRATLGHKSKDLLKNFGYLAARACGGFGVDRIRRIVDRCGPGWLSARDHFYAVLRKRA
jgi:SAM-dependent methyltransferase